MVEITTVLPHIMMKGALQIEFIFLRTMRCGCVIDDIGFENWDQIRAHIENRIKEGVYSSDKTDIRDLRIGDFVKVTKPGGYCKVGDIVEVFSISKEGINHWKDMGASGFIPIDGFEYVDKSKQQLEGKPKDLKTK